jgi:hypothetical protein
MLKQVLRDKAFPAVRVQPSEYHKKDSSYFNRYAMIWMINVFWNHVQRKLHQ